MNTKRERVIAEQSRGGWLVMWPDGRINFYVDKLAVKRAVKARLGTADIMVTEIEWRA